MIIAVTAIILTTIIICATIAFCSFINDYDVRLWFRKYKDFSQARNIIVNTVEIGDRLSDEELQLLYKLVK